MARLMTVCEGYLGDQRLLLDLLVGGASPAVVALAMEAHLDQLAAALREARRHRIPTRRAEPGW